MDGFLRLFRRSIIDMYAIDYGYCLGVEVLRVMLGGVNSEMLL